MKRVRLTKREEALGRKLMRHIKTLDLLSPEDVDALTAATIRTGSYSATYTDPKGIASFIQLVFDHVKS